VDSNEPLWHPLALAEAKGARAWYAERSPQAARGFLLVLEEAVQAVMEAPERWPEVRPGRRLYVFPNQYPFNLVYRFEEEVREYIK
jgi:plasmid stabilization system protein ParE